MPRVDEVSNIMSTSVTRENGFTTISFIRPLNTLDTTDDISLSENRYFMYAWGGTFDYQTGNIGKHPMTPTISNGLIILPDICLGKNY